MVTGAAAILKGSVEVRAAEEESALGTLEFATAVFESGGTVGAVEHGVFICRCGGSGSFFCL